MLTTRLTQGDKMIKDEFLEYLESMHVPGSRKRKVKTRQPTPAHSTPKPLPRTARHQVATPKPPEAKGPKKVRLTPTESKVLFLLSQDQTAEEVAGKMGVSKRTIDFHIGEMSKKFQVSGRDKIIKAGVRYGVIPFEPSNPRFFI